MYRDLCVYVSHAQLRARAGVCVCVSYIWADLGSPIVSATTHTLPALFLERIIACQKQNPVFVFFCDWS